MADNENAIDAAGSEKPASAATEISYCPHLDLYHYRRADGSEYFFDGPQLVKSCDAYMSTGNAREAEFMATLTSFARHYPHQVVSFDDKGVLKLSELSPAPMPGADDPGDEKADKP